MLNDNPALKKFSEQPVVLPANSKKVNNYRTNAIITIPVVVHIVLNNPNVITEADVQWQIDKLNIDYAGINPDSTNEPPAFVALRGHSQIRFALARRTPAGAITNGIERIISSAGSNVGLSVDPIKRSSSGGADVWDPNSYLNFWVGNDASGFGILGYAQFPGSSSAADDGIFINVRSWGNNPCYVLSKYNLGRTAVHEAGHYFGLFHIWGDEDGCTGDDFKSLSSAGSNCILPAGLFNPTGQGNTASDIGDTPNQGASSTGLCPSGVKTDACTTIAPGIMYQDYMDYTDDACYSMFTKKQVERMEYALDNCRSSLKNSPGATIPAGAPLIDASPYQSVSPGGLEVVSCTSILYPSTLPCPGTFVPKIRIRNNGLTTLNTVTVGLLINGVAQASINISQTLPFGYTTVVSFPLLNVVAGTYTFKFFTANPNGVQPDNVPSNDTLTTILTVAAPLSLPVSEGFEGTVFPPTGWLIYNPNNDVTWVKVTPGNNSNFSAAIDNYNNDAQGKIDDLRTPKINFTSADSVIIISFDVAHKAYPDSTNYDTLSVLVSKDCGATFTNVYKKYGPNLATADTSSLAYITPAQSDWRKEKITLKGNLLSAGNIIVAFRNTNRFGNNIFLDNINIAPPSPGDVTLVSINDPAPVICAGTVSPAVTIQNIGSESISSLNISYSFDNAPALVTTFSGLNLLPAQQTSITLTPPFTLTGVGAHIIKVYISNVLTINGTTDRNSSNDTLTKTFTIAGKVNAPLTEGFETAVFPPVNWALDNPDGSITWERTTVAAKSGIASMVIRNFDYPALNTVDKFATPIISGISLFDSLIVSFDLAYSPKPGTTGPFDTLELQATTDCGKTFTTIWQKGGTDLQTTASASSTRFTPTASDWKNIRASLTPFIKNGSVQIYFVAKSNNQNNLYIDNINVFGITLPAAVKQKGYELYPNPFKNSFVIQSLFTPTDLQSIQVFNSVGQVVWQNQLNGLGNALMTVDLSKVSAGLYFVKLNYTTRTIVEKITKQ